MYSCSSDYLWYPYDPEYHSYCYQNVISRDNTGLSPADNIKWLGCIIASRGVNLNIRFQRHLHPALYSNALVSPCHQLPSGPFASSQPPSPCVFFICIPRSAAIFRRAETTFKHNTLRKHLLIIVSSF